MSGRVLVLGSLNVDLVTRVERHPRPGETVLGDGLEQLAGGKGANQAVAAAAAGATVAMVGCVGDDAGGTAYLARLGGRGIDTSAVRVCPGVPTGHAVVTVSDDGENSIVVIPGANDLLDDREVGAVDALGPGDVLLVQLEVPRAVVCTAVRRAAGRGARVVLNTAPYAALPADVVALADPVVANEHEMAALAEAGARAALAAGHLRGQRGVVGRRHRPGPRGRARRGRRHHRGRRRVLRRARGIPGLGRTARRGARRRPGSGSRGGPASGSPARPPPLTLCFPDFAGQKPVEIGVLPRVARLLTCKVGEGPWVRWGRRPARPAGRPPG